MSIILRENEKIIKSAREHVLFLVPGIVVWVALVALLATWRFYGDFDFYGYDREVLIGAAIIATVAVLARLFRWKRTVLVLTSQRVVCLVQQGLFSRTVIELLYKDVKELSYTKEGIMASLLGFGDLHLRSTADVTHTFEHIPKPDQLVAMVSAVR